MITIDLSILLAAVNKRAPEHKQVHAWWENLLNSSEQVTVSWLVILGFIRLTTNPKVLPEPLLLADAISVVDGWLARPNVEIVQVTTRHWNIMQHMLHAVGHGSTLTMDAHLACLAIEHDAELATLDEDFALFPGLKWINPVNPKQKQTDNTSIE
jgi:toxin-antitoxin system PIN domain toxin